MSSPVDRKPFAFTGPFVYPGPVKFRIGKLPPKEVTFDSSPGTITIIGITTIQDPSSSMGKRLELSKLTEEQAMGNQPNLKAPEPDQEPGLGDFDVGLDLE